MINAIGNHNVINSIIAIRIAELYNLTGSVVQEGNKYVGNEVPSGIKGRLTLAVILIVVAAMLVSVGIIVGSSGRKLTNEKENELQIKKMKAEIDEQLTLDSVKK